jgi:hypothetical protein
LEAASNPTNPLMGTGVRTIQAHRDKRILTTGHLFSQFRSAQDSICFHRKTKVLASNVFKDLFDLRMEEGFSTG